MIIYTVKVNDNGDKFWCLDGKLHRVDGPAIEWADGGKIWYLDGKELTQAQWKQAVINRRVLARRLKWMA